MSGDLFPMVAQTCRGLPEGDSLRRANLGDRLAMTWLTRISQWVYTPPDHERLSDLLSKEPGVLWLRGRTIRGALLYSLFRHPVASLSMLAARSAADRPVLLDCLLPYTETYLTGIGVEWVSLHRAERWLLDELALRGYSFQARVITYHKMGLRTDTEGHPDLHVRPALADDLPAIVRLDVAAFAPFWRLNEAILRQSLIRSYFIVTEYGGQIIGYLTAERAGQEGYISRIGVEPAWQGQGVGARLMVEAFRLLAQDGLQGAWLNTQEDNRRSRHLYERLGFRFTGESEDFWGKQLTARSSERNTDLHETSLKP